MPETKGCIVILAAGSSERLGHPKQLLKIDNQTVIKRMFEIANSVAEEKVLIVLGANERLIKDNLYGISANLTVNQDWMQGLGSSIRVGINQAEKNWPEADYIILMLCDQIMVNKNILLKLIEEYTLSGKPLIASAYEESYGPPLLIHHSYFDKFCNISGDQGAKSVLKRYHQDVGLINFPSGDVDIDTEEDVVKLMQLFNNVQPN